MPLIGTEGAASAQGFGMFSARPAANFIEDVFSTWLYTGTGSTQTITNGIDLAGKGGLLWIKTRINPGGSFTSHTLWDSARLGLTNQPFGAYISSDTTSSQVAYSSGSNHPVPSSSGFSLSGGSFRNNSGESYASWTFRKQPKFFDIVTWTGNDTLNRTIPHNLGSVPGCIIVKATNDNTVNWGVYHRSLVASRTSPNYVPYLTLNRNTVTDDYFAFNDPSSSGFVVSPPYNTTGFTYVAYLFAHDAGGFGATGADNVISCSSYTGNGSVTGPVVTLGYEPQWLLIKRASGGTGDWQIIDNMRGMPVGSADAALQANLTNAESSVDYVSPTATGFQVTSTSSEVNTNGSTYIYIAIRRGPMRTPTSGTSVFSPIASGSAQGTQQTTNFPVDTQLSTFRTFSSNRFSYDRLRGVSTNSTSSGVTLFTNTTGAEFSNTGTQAWGNTGFETSSIHSFTQSIYWNFRRAPGFFDVVCYTGTGVARTVSHNLGVVPELMIVKQRSGSIANWVVYSQTLGAGRWLRLNADDASLNSTFKWNNTAPTNAVFSVNDSETNGSGNTYVAYLFASCPGVSKVGTFTGTGATQTIDCGFAAGARFVLIKRTDSTGDWYVWDSARGIVAGNDPYLLLNSDATEVTNTDWVDTAASGFELSNAAGNLVNTNGGSYIFLSVS